MKNILIGVLVGAVAILGYAYLSDSNSLGSVSGAHTERACAVSTVAATAVGHQESLTILAANSQRAWARIQQLSDSVNVVTLSFDEGAAATTGNGLVLGSLTATSSEDHIEFGKKTPFPYTGIVTGISDTSTTTLLVTQCIY